jgi:hypothetical protein
MLPGGLAIVGAYLFAGADASAALLPKMQVLLHSIRSRLSGTTPLVFLCIKSLSRGTHHTQHDTRHDTTHDTRHATR